MPAILVKDSPPELNDWLKAEARIKSLTEGRIFLSSVTAAELYFGAFNSAHPSERETFPTHSRSATG